MCEIFTCFAMILDLIQRLITYFLACWIGIVVCVACLIALGAGLAFGYNYFVAELLTHTRADVSVFMRRGQFFDEPDVRDQFQVPQTASKDTRRAGDTHDYEEVKLNPAVDYVDSKPAKEEKSLSELWLKAKEFDSYGKQVNSLVQSANTDRPTTNTDKEQTPTKTTTAHLATVDPYEPLVVNKIPTPHSPKAYTSQMLVNLNKTKQMLSMLQNKSNDNLDYFYKFSDEIRARAEERATLVEETTTRQPDIRIKIGNRRKHKATTPEAETISTVIDDTDDEDDVYYSRYKPV